MFRSSGTGSGMPAAWRAVLAGDGRLACPDDDATWPPSPAADGYLCPACGGVGRLAALRDIGVPPHRWAAVEAAIAAHLTRPRAAAPAV